jgi:tripartite ATP-independent transporter DctP family solute receptor
MRRREFIALLGAGGGGRTQNLRAQQSATPLVGLQPLLLILMPFRIFQNVITLGCSSLLVFSFNTFSTSVAADYKRDFKTSIVVNQENPWGRAAERFADALRYRTQGRIQIKNYFNGQLFAGQQTTEFALLQEGGADFAINSTINWSLQVKELNLFSLPFMFPSYNGLDAVQAGDPGRQIFSAIEQKGVVPIAWGENGFRELTNSKRSIRTPDDLHDLTIRVPPIPMLAETFKALGANPVSMNFDQALTAFERGTVDGQENPIALIIPYKLWTVHNYITLWHYAIDPLILAVSAKTWAGLSLEDRNTVRQVGKAIMELQKDEAREAPVKPSKLVELLQDMYGMEVVRPSTIELEAFRNRTRGVFNKWSEQIGIRLVGEVERTIDKAK